MAVSEADKHLAHTVYKQIFDLPEETPDAVHEADIADAIAEAREAGRQQGIREALYICEEAEKRLLGNFYIWMQIKALLPTDATPEATEEKGEI